MTDGEVCHGGRVHPITATRVFDMDAGSLFDRITALKNHERLIPFTRIEAPGRRPRVGDTVVATSLGVIRDVMLLTRYERPGARGGNHSGTAMYRKVGPLLLGTAEITVTPLPDHTARVDWTEEVHLAGPFPTELTSAVVGHFLTLMTGRALRRFELLNGAR